MSSRITGAGTWFLKNEDGKIEKLNIIQDDMPESPREFADHYTKMYCWHSSYSLGDKHDWSTPNDFLKMLVREYVSDSDVVAYVKTGRAEHMIMYKNESDVDEKKWRLEEIWGHSKPEWQCFESYDDPEDAYGYILDNLKDTDLLVLTKESKKMIMLPLFLYSHSGLAMSTTDYHDRWDSGQVGWIWCDKETFLKETGYTEDELFNKDDHRTPIVGNHVKIKGRDTNKWDWFEVRNVDTDKREITIRKSCHIDKTEEIVSMDDILEVMADYATKILEADVECYDDYLRGYVYGFQLFEVDEEYPYKKGHKWFHEEDRWVETESCWEFYGWDAEENGIIGEVGQKWLIAVENEDKLHENDEDKQEC